MKSIPNLEYSKLQPKAQEKPVGKYGNLKNYLHEKGVEIDEATLDKKMRTFFEDMITEVLKNPTQWDRTRNINFMELFKYLGGQEEESQEQPQEQMQEQPVEKMGKRAEIKKETREYKMTASGEVLNRLEMFLRVLITAGNVGHSGTFGMGFDGDGSDKLKVEPEPVGISEIKGSVGELEYGSKFIHDNKDLG